MIRTAWVALVGGLVTAVLSAHIGLAEWLGWSRTLERICQTHPRWWARVMLWTSGVKVEFEGLEHLEGGGPRVLVANHESWFDVLALTAYLPFPYRFVAKKELEKVPLWGRAWQACGHISMDRQNHQAALQSLERARRASGDEDVVMIVFPEGTRSPDGAMLPFKKGAFVLALQLGVPVVPAAILGGRRIMPKGEWRIRSGPVRIRIGQPIPVEGLKHGDRGDLLRRSREAVAALRGGAGTVDAVDISRGTEAGRGAAPPPRSERTGFGEDRGR